MIAWIFLHNLSRSKTQLYSALILTTPSLQAERVMKRNGSLKIGNYRINRFLKVHLCQKNLMMIMIGHTNWCIRCSLFRHTYVPNLNVDTFSKQVKSIFINLNFSRVSNAWVKNRTLFSIKGDVGNKNKHLHACNFPVHLKPNLFYRLLRRIRRFFKTKINPN